jgi:hypothetical protein
MASCGFTEIEEAMLETWLPGVFPSAGGIGPPVQSLLGSAWYIYQRQKLRNYSIATGHSGTLGNTPLRIKTHHNRQV